MKIRLKKLKHLYLAYGIINTVIIVAVLFVVYFLYSQYSTLDKYISAYNKELINVIENKQFSSSLSINDFLTNQTIKTKQTFISKAILSSKSHVQDILEDENISDLDFIENSSALLKDYEALRLKNDLLFQYFENIGSADFGLYGKFKKAESNLLLKIEKYSLSEKIIYKFKILDKSIELLISNKTFELSDDINSQISQLSEIIDKIEPNKNSYAHLRIKDAYTNFTSSYYAFAKQVFAIGLNNKIGLIYEIELNYRRIAKRLENLLLITESKKASTKRVVIIFLSIAVVLILTFNLLVSNFFVKIIHNVFNAITKFIDKLIQGKTSLIVENNFIEESQQLLKILNKFGTQISNSQKAINSLKQGRNLPKIESNEHSLFFYSGIKGIQARMQTMNNKLEDEIKKVKQISWINKGIAKITEILRSKYDNPTLHSDELISTLVGFLDLPIGAIYMVDNKNITMLSAFAYGKKKRMKKRLIFGEGVVGTAASERRSLIMTNIPQDYFEIVSAFGSTKPRSILVSPIKLNEEVYGVIELASLQKFKPEVVDFVEEICKTIAYSFAISKIYSETLIKVDNLDLEINQLQTENASLLNDYSELNESYRQVTQKLSDNILVMQSIDDTAMIVDVDLDGNIIEYNVGFDRFFQSVGIHNFSHNFREYLAEINISDGFDIDEIWRDLKTGIKFFGIQKSMMFEKQFILHQFFIPVQNDEGKVMSIKIIMFNSENG